MGEVRDYYIEDLAGFVDFFYDTPCPKLPARILLDDFTEMLSLNIRKDDCDCYTMKPYPISHHIEEEYHG